MEGFVQTLFWKAFPDSAVSAWQSELHKNTNKSFFLQAQILPQFYSANSEACMSATLHCEVLCYGIPAISGGNKILLDQGLTHMCVSKSIINMCNSRASRPFSKTTTPWVEWINILEAPPFRNDKGLKWINVGMLPKSDSRINKSELITGQSYK